jgi:riboflavin kinase/FMN adenylyltransferase
MSKSNGFHTVHGSAEDIAIGPLHGTVVAIGNFDGVHRGHRAVIGAALKRAKALGRPAAALTFSPHPRLFLRPQDTLFQLSSPRDKLRLLAASGLDGAIVMNFDAQLAATSAADFIERILVGRFGIGGAAIGFDFHFGHKRTGSPAYLAEQGARLGFAVDIVAPLEDEGRPVSSGAVRTALAQGKVVEATELLGAPWFASGEVIHGAKRGRDLGFPTANIKLDPSCGLKHGIYAVRVAVPDSVRSRASGNPGAAGASLAGSPLSASALRATADFERAEAREASEGGSRGRAEKLYDGVANFGTRPMFEDGAPLLEVFLFDFDGDLYGQALDVAFIGWIRHEQKFESVEALKRQIAADAAQARDVLQRAGDIFPVLGEI